MTIDADLDTPAAQWTLLFASHLPNTDPFGNQVEMKLHPSSKFF